MENEREKVKVVINGRVTEVEAQLSFDEITRLAYPEIDKSNPNIEWEVDWRYAESRPGDEHELQRREILRAKRGMMIDVSYSDKS